MDTGNNQLVAVQGEMILVMNPKQRMTREEALLHAAWLVALADRDDSFPKILEVVQGT